MNILLTGVSKGLGLATAKILLREGFSVWGISRSVSPELSALAREYGAKLQLIEFDLGQPGDIKQRIFKVFMDLDVVISGFVNNAAIAYDDLVTNIDHERLETMFRTNVISPIILTKYVIRNMLLHKTRGSLVHISSISVHTGYKGLSMYASSKAALEGFSKNIAREWGEKGIRSNVVVAGFMETDMNASLNDEQKQRIYQRTCLKKATDIKSVVAMIEFLLSEKSSSITGQNVFVDSGTI